VGEGAVGVGVVVAVAAEAILEEATLVAEAVAQVGTLPQVQALVTCPASVNLLLGLVLVELSVSPLLSLALVEHGRESAPVLVSVDPGPGSPLGPESRPGRVLRLGQELLPPQITILQQAITTIHHTSSSTQVTVTITVPARSLSDKRSMAKTVIRVSTTIISNSLLRPARRIVGISGRQGGRSVT